MTMLCLICVFTVLSYSQGLQISGCENGRMDVPENSIVTVACTGIESWSPVQWDLQPDTTVSSHNVANCSSTKFCTVASDYRDQINATRPNQQTSVLYVKVSPYRKQIPRVTCQTSVSAECSFRPVHTEPPSQCKLEIKKDVRTVSGKCDIHKIYSSDDAYDCQWQQQFDSMEIKDSPGKMSLTSFFDNTNRQEYRRGSCSFIATQFVIMKGVFTFNITLRPGTDVHIATVHVDDSSMTVSKPSFVEVTVDDVPLAEKVADTTPTSPRTAPGSETQSSTTPGRSDSTATTRACPHFTNKASVSDGGEKSYWTYIAAGCGAAVFIAVVVIGIIILRKVSVRRKYFTSSSQGSKEPATYIPSFTELEIASSSTERSQAS